MTPGELANLAGVILIAIGLIATWSRNGRSTAEKYGALTEQVKQANTKLDGHGEKLDDIQTCVSEQRVNCATISTSLKERLESLEREAKQ